MQDNAAASWEIICKHLQKHCREKKDFSKRIFDIFFSLIILFLIFPIAVLISILVLITSNGPIFYPSTRIGAAGRVIRCWKFRTMHPNADTILKDLLSQCPELRKEWEENFKLKKDPRITKIGTFLRKTSLDELPQFWNVLKGDMSTVGPRPLSIEEVGIVIEKGKEQMLSIKPGITGLWQTSGRSLISFDKRLDMELHYVDKRSFWLDIYLILKTIPMMVFHKGAY